MQNLVTIALALTSLALAKTDLTGCTSSVSGPSLIWYVPGTGELCEFLDCGGGRAPPKTTVPGCAAYSGTATYSPNYLPGYGPNATPTSSMATMGPGPVAPEPTGYGYGSPTSYAMTSATTSAASSTSNLWGWATTDSSRAELFSSNCQTSTDIASTASSIAVTTAPPMYASSMSASSMVWTTSTAGSNITITTSASPAPSVFQGPATHNSVTDGLGFIGVMIAALALA